MTRTISKPKRRAAVLISYASFLVLAILLSRQVELPVFLHIALLLTSGIVFVISLNFLYNDTQLWHFGNAPDDQLDERQVQVRNRAYRLAYSGVAGVFILTMIYYAFAVDKNLWLPKNWNEADVMVWTVIFTALTLPSSILAWMEEEV